MQAVIDMELQPVCPAQVSNKANLNRDALGHKQLLMPACCQNAGPLSAVKAEVNCLVDIVTRRHAHLVRAYPQHLARPPSLCWSAMHLQPYPQVC